MKTILKYPSQLTIILIMAIMLMVNGNLNWGGDYWKGIVEADAKGYYAYLPAIFIYDDLNFGFFAETEGSQYYNKTYFYDYRSHAHGYTINKYYIGTAVAQLPFFLVTHLTTEAGHDDGYTKPYAVMVTLAALFYLIIGLIMLDRVLMMLKIKDLIRVIVLVALTFGTNLFYYAVIEPGMSHVYSFAFVAIFLYLALKWMKYENFGALVAMGFTLGMIVLIRPVNGLVVLTLPLLAGGLKRLLVLLKPSKAKLIAAVAAIGAFASVAAIQLGYYKVATDHWWVYSYVNEGFNFLKPQIVEFLISYRKGLFLYTPIYLVAFALGFYKTPKAFKWLWGLFFLAIVWVMSSWWMWYYGGSFSSRVMVEYLPVFGMAMAYGLTRLDRKKLLRIAVPVLAFLVLFCQGQMMQYRYMMIHWSDMTKEMYWDNFLLTFWL